MRKAPVTIGRVAAAVSVVIEASSAAAFSSALTTSLEDLHAALAQRPNGQVSGTPARRWSGGNGVMALVSSNQTQPSN